MEKHSLRSDGNAALRSSVIGVFAVLGTLVTVLGLWKVSLRYQASEFRKTATAQAEGIRDQIAQGLDDRIKSVERMAGRLEVYPQMPEFAWRGDAKLHLKHLGVLEGISVINANKHVRWIEPKALTQKLVGMDLSKDAFRNRYLDQAIREKKTIFTPVTELKQGGRGFMLIVPIFVKGKLNGFIGSSMLPDKLVRKLLDFKDYEISLTSGSETIFNNLSQSAEFNEQWAVQLPFDLHGEPLVLTASPTLSTIHAMDSSAPNLILFVGVLISLLLGLMIYFASSLRVQSGVFKEQRNFLDAVVDASPLGIVVLDQSHHITLWTPACEAMFGWSEKEVIGKPLPFVSDDRRAQSRSFIEQVLQSGELREADILRHRKDGSEIIVHISGMALRRQGEVYGMMAVMQDVTEQRIAHKEVWRAREIAEKAAASKSEFLANMSHEIRTPLNGIIGMSDLLLDTEMADEQKRYSNIIQNSATTLLTLINDILDLSKIEAGKMQIENLDFSLASVVETQVEVLISKAREKNLSLVTFVSPDLPRTVRGDPGRISQVLLNLVGNAIKFTQSGGVILKVIPAGEQIRFEIKDTGIGLSESAKDKLFKPFTQVDGSTARRYGGTGLGLSISKNLVEQMGGRIGIESVESEGALFWFELPLTWVTISVRHDILGEDRSKKILVVDHDPISLDVLKKYFDAWKIEAVCINDKTKVIPCIQDAAQKGRHYDVVLLSSVTLGQEIRKELKENSPRLVLMLDFNKSLSEENRNQTFAEVINKPVKQSQLYDSIVRNDLPLVTPISPVMHLAPVFKDARILVADDVAANQMLAMKFLEKLGYHAQAVANGKEVIDELEKGHFDLILMDCQMPEMDGFEATRLIREMKDERLSRIPIIALTANALEGDAENCIAAGMNDYLSKPFKKEHLGEIMEKWLKDSSSGSKFELN